MAPAGCDKIIRSANLAWWATMFGSRPVTATKLAVGLSAPGFASATAKPSLGGQFSEQVVCGAFLISIGSNVPNTAKCAFHNRATKTAVENAASAVTTACNGRRIFRIAICSTPIPNAASVEVAVPPAGQHAIWFRSTSALESRRRWKGHIRRSPKQNLSDALEQISPPRPA